MASNTPGGHQDMFRHRITSIKLEPSTSDHEISLKILVDGQEAHRLSPVKRGAPLTWNRTNHCDVHSGSRVELRVYEKHFFNLKRVGTLEYGISTVIDQAEATFEFDTKLFRATMSFPTPDATKNAHATALAEAQATEKKTRPLERLGPAREALKTILDFGEAISELHPAAKIAFGVCKLAWDTLEKQEQCDASVEKLVVGLAGMLPYVDQVDRATKSSPLQRTVESMMNLIEDASRFVVEYRSDGGPVQGLRAVVGSKAQDQVQDLLSKFGRLKEEFDTGVGVQTLETTQRVREAVDEVHEVLLTSNQRTLLNELKPVASARHDAARACLSGTRISIIDEIVDWSQRRDQPEGLLWVHGQAGLGKSSIATSVCQELDEKKALTAGFFCKRDTPERRDPQRVLSSIVYGLASRHAGYAKFVAEAILRDSQLCGSPIQIQYDSLVKAPLEMFAGSDLSANLVVVVDALDECGTNESRRQLLAYLHLMSRLTSWLKVIVTSRPDSDIVSFFKDKATTGVSKLDLYRHKASDDIELYIRHRMLNSHRSKYLPPNAPLLLSEHANGLFIWAKTACDFILNSHKAISRFDQITGGAALNQTSSPLDALYTAALEASLGDGGAEDAECVQECLGAIIACSTRTPLSVANLSALLGDQVEMSVLQSVVDSLGSVLYTDPTQGGVVRVYHHSFTDYITSSAPSRFRMDVERQNTDFARACLRTMLGGLKFNICGLETSHIPNSKVADMDARIDAQIDQPLRYSSLYWTSHLTQSRKGELTNMLRDLMLQPTLLYWIEVLSLLGRLDVAMSSALEMSEWCQEPEELQQCAMDTYRFLLAFYDPISHSTPHLYVSALALCPAHTAFAERLQPLFRRTLAVTRGAEVNWSPWLRCISHPAAVYAIAVSKDGRRIASGSNDFTVRLWDAHTGAPLGDPLVGHLDGVWSVEFSPDGRRIVSGSHDNTVRLWDADTGAAIGEPLVGHSDWVWSVGFSPDGRHIVSGSDDNTVRLWDADTGAAIGDPLVGHSGWVRSVGFSPDSRCIVSGSYDNTVRLWDVDTRAAIGDPLVGHSDGVCSVEFSPDGRRIVSGSGDKTARLWDTEKGKALGSPLAGHSSGINSVRFSSDGHRIVSCSDDKMVQVWDADTGTALGDALVGHAERVWSVVFSPNGRRIISCSEDRTVRVWDVDTRVALGDPLVGHSERVWSVGFSPDGRRIVSGSDDRTVRVWDTDTGAATGNPLVGHSDSVRSVGFSPDGRRIVSGSHDNTVRLWDADTGAAIGDPLVGHSDWVRSVGFSPDGHRIVSGSDDSTVRMWDAHTRAAIGEPLVGHSGGVCSVDFSPDGHRIVSGSDDRTMRVWDTDTGAALGDPHFGHSGYVTSVRFSPDGRRIVSGSDDNTVRMWDADTGAAIGDPLVGHSDTVRSVGFSPDGRRIVSGSHDNTVRLWDADTGAAIGEPLVGHSDFVRSVGFLPDGRRIVSGSDDNAVRVWEATGGDSTSLALTTSRMADSLSSGGWVRNTGTEELLIWLPDEYRRRDYDASLLVISKKVRKHVFVNGSRFVHGSDWASVRTL